MGGVGNVLFIAILGLCITENTAAYRHGDKLRLRAKRRHGYRKVKHDRRQRSLQAVDATCTDAVAYAYELSNSTQCGTETCSSDCTAAVNQVQASCLSGKVQRAFVSSREQEDGTITSATISYSAAEAVRLMKAMPGCSSQFDWNGVISAAKTDKPDCDQLMQIYFESVDVPALCGDVSNARTCTSPCQRIINEATETCGGEDFTGPDGDEHFFNDIAFIGPASGVCAGASAFTQVLQHVMLFVIPLACYLTM